MKTSLLSALFLFLVIPALNAQNDFRFADSTAQWNVVSATFLMIDANSYQYRTIIHSAGKDTIIGSRHYQIINRQAGQFLYSHYVRRDTSGKIFVLNTDSIENLVCDFGRDPGDTVTLSWLWGSVSNDILFVVDSVDTINLLYPRKRVFVSTKPYNTVLKDVWIEGIGNVNNYFLDPMDQFSCCDHPSYSLLCFFERDSLLFHDNSLTTACLYDTSTYNSVDEFGREIYVEVLPNPTKNAITIQSETSFTAQSNFQLFDIAGRMILQRPLNDKVNRVALDGISKGLYLYAITSKGQNISSGKLAVQ